MTRLITEWIFQMEDTAASWSEELEKMVGLDFVQLSEVVAGAATGNTTIASQSHRVAVVPVTSGLGKISSFAESVAAIVRVAGYDAQVTSATDVNGIYEAYQNDADIIYMADDDRYIAMNLKNGKIADNNIATAKGYVTILERMASSLKARNVAVLGFGIIGKLMAGYLEEKGAAVAIYDKDPMKQQLIRELGYECISDISELKNYKYIADGTSEGEWLDDSMLSPDVKIAAPGVPLSLTSKAQKNLTGRYVNDYLEIGTIGMLGMVL